MQAISYFHNPFLHESHVHKVANNIIHLVLAIGPQILCSSSNMHRGDGYQPACEGGHTSGAGTAPPSSSSHAYTHSD